MSVFGVGVDVVGIERFRVSLQRTPSLRERLFVPVELEYVAAKQDPVPSLAARAIKRGGDEGDGTRPRCLGFHDVWSPPRRVRATAQLVGRANELAVERAITTWHLSLSHDGPVAIATAVGSR